MIADHTKEIEILRGKIAYLLAQKPPKRKLANQISAKLNHILNLQIKRETWIAERQLKLQQQYEASRCREPSLGVSPQNAGDGGSPDTRSM